MTTYTVFQPPPNNSFSFQPTLDGNSCTGIVWWNADGQRWFITVTLPDGTPLFNLPLVGSPTSIALQSLTWANGYVIGTTQAPHGYEVLDTIMLTVSGCAPVAYNGTFPCFINSPTTFRYNLDANPNGAGLDDGTDIAVQLGAVSSDLNLGAGYLSVSTIVFREAAQTFEVNP